MNKRYNKVYDILAKANPGLKPYEVAAKTFDIMQVTDPDLVKSMNTFEVKETEEPVVSQSVVENQELALIVLSETSSLPNELKDMVCRYLTVYSFLDEYKSMTSKFDEHFIIEDFNRWDNLELQKEEYTRIRDQLFPSIFKSSLHNVLSRAYNLMEKSALHNDYDNQYKKYQNELEREEEYMEKL